MNDVTKIENNDFMSKYQKTENIVEDVRNIIEVSQKEAYRAVNTILSQRNWLIGYRIAEEELAGEGRAEYGVEIIKRLSRELTDKYGKGYHRNLLGGLYRENPVKSRNYEAVKSSKKWENVGDSYIIPALLLYRYSYI